MGKRLIFWGGKERKELTSSSFFFFLVFFVCFSRSLSFASFAQSAITIKGLKASGFAGAMLPGQGSGLVTDCDELTQEAGECETIPY